MTEGTDTELSGQKTDPDNWDDVIAASLTADEDATEETPEAVAADTETRGDQVVDDAAKAAQEGAAEAVAEAAGVAEVEEALFPPTAWSKDRRALFDQIGQMGQEGVELTPRQVQQFAMDLFKEEQSRAGTAVEEARISKERLQNFENATADLHQSWAMQNMSPENGLARLVAFESWMMNDPGQAIQWVANLAGLDLRQLVEAQPYMDPEVLQLRNEMAHNRQRMDRQDQQVSREQTEAVLSEVVKFEEAKDKAGNLAHPYFKEVVGLMIAMTQGAAAQGIQVDVDQIYNLACQQTPGVQDRYNDDIARVQAATTTAQTVKAAATAQKSEGKGEQRIAGKGKQSPDQSSSPNSWEDAIEKTMAEAESSGL